MKIYDENGESREVALFAKNPAGKTVVITTHFDSEELDEEQEQYVIEELGEDFEVFVDEL